MSVPFNKELAIQYGREVCQKEINTLIALRDSIGDEFAEANEMMMNHTHAQIPVLGMGKSGHIGKKVAATLASTGTPSFFVHPAEASHGDMGMLNIPDIVIMISNSGKSTEFIDPINFCKARGKKIIAFCNKRESRLGRAADVFLDLRVFEEACPLNIAPTSSTTATLALGDMIAITIMRLRGFTAADFNAYHPGGNIGVKTATCDSLMDKLVVIDLNETSKQVNNTIHEGGLGCGVVLDDNGKLAGFIANGDMTRLFNRIDNNKDDSISYNEFCKLKAKDIMTTSPKTVLSNELATGGVEIMNDHKIANVIVIDSETDKPVGILEMKTCLAKGLI